MNKSYGMYLTQNSNVDTETSDQWQDHGFRSDDGCVRKDKNNS